MANSVELIDPIKSVSNLPNGTPEYEKLFIFAELLGERRERSVLTLNDNQGSVSLKTQLNNTNVNMLGVNYKADINNSASFTTNWTDNESNISTKLEGFGINKIDVNINSSFMPRVSIEFVDIRGATFFNLGENSPYSLLFDFPPPIFRMTLKGYYGKSLDYDLHLVKHNTRFDSNNGNYYINVEFVARTFAPLADIPFKFSELVAIMAKQTEPPTDPKIQESGMQDINNVTNQDELNFDPRVAPRNTYELVEKLKRLTDELKDIKNTSKEGKILDETREGVIEGDKVIQYMDSFSSFVGSLYENNAFIIVKKGDVDPNNNTKDDGGEFKVINGVKVYNSIIKESEDSGNNSNSQPDKLYLGILSERIRNNNQTGNTDTSLLNEVLIGYKKSLLSRGKNFAGNNIDDGFIGEPKTIYNYKPSDVTQNDANESSKNYDKYIGLDITKFYTEVEKVLKKKRDLSDKAQGDLVNVVNSELKNILGFKPSIYNIFKILCDDLDIFFKQLGKISKDSETHHNKYFDLIIDEIQEDKSKRVTKKIYPFPLYVKEDTTCGVTRKVRNIPVFDGLDEPFPEVKFVNNFIDEMIAVKKREDIKEMRTQIDVNGNNRWIPITPADSKLHGEINYESPYSNLSDSDINAIDTIYTRLLNRFYIASQFTYGESFYSEDEKTGFINWGSSELKRDDLIKYIARSEAINVANSITNDAILQSLKDKSSFKNDPDSFYGELSKLPLYSNIPNNVLTLTDDITNLYRDRNDSNFVGVEIIDIPPSTRTNGDENSNDPIDIFLNEDTAWYDNLSNFFSPSNKKKINNFTVENIPYFPDYTDGDSDSYTTKFLNGMELTWLPFYGNFDSTTQFTTIYNSKNPKAGYDPSGLYSDGNYATTLSTILALYIDDVKEFLENANNDYSQETQAFILSSMFGRARSYFSELGERDGKTLSSKIGNVNNMFLNPAVVEVPRFSTYYMGGLLEYNKGTEVFDEVNKLLETEWFQAISVDGGYIKDDADRMANIGFNDGKIFFDEYDRWSNPPSNNSGYIALKKDLIVLIEDILTNNSIEDDISDRQEEILKLIKQGNLRSIDNDMVVKTTILNYSEYTFNNSVNENITYEPLSITNESTDGNNNSKSSANNLFFNTFWEKLDDELKVRDEELTEIESDFRSVVDDEDIKTQLYYSFKNISDKWISGIDTAKRGFPLNFDEKDSLISKFAFVDRAMNPIGEDVVINAEALIEMSQDYDINMFQVFSRLLSLNGFEFFPLQNFMSFNNKDGNWSDAFNTFTTIEQKPTPAFVCMYIGGTSSTLENATSAFDNDGILDLDEAGLPDFSNIGDCSDSQEVKDSESRSKSQNEGQFKYSEPKAFRVRFGEQNQSFFTNIEIEGRDFPETADSLAILSRIAGDGKTTAPVPKGQNMFSIYENRAYSVSVTMLGNVMIQPTQYFQLENIPMYSGAYMITDVSHRVTANHMTTTFKGVKVLKFPNPFVKNFATIVGIESGTSEDLSGIAGTEISDAISARTLPENNSGKYYNEQFSLKISP